MGLVRRRTVQQGHNFFKLLRDDVAGIGLSHAYILNAVDKILNRRLEKRMADFAPLCQPRP